jgi:uncharacterized protein YfaS (alpha-2-macroglobulin family)
VPVFLTNMSGAARDIEVELSASEIPIPGMIPAEAVGEDRPILEITGASKKMLRLEDSQSGTVVFDAVANKQVGAARLTVAARADDLRSYDELEVPFHPTGARVRDIERIEVTEAGDIDLTRYLQGWVPTTDETNIWVTSNPFGDSFSHLNYLIRYPYG